MNFALGGMSDDKAPKPPTVSHWLLLSKPFDWEERAQLCKDKGPFFAKLNTLHPQLSFITEEILNKTGM